MIGDQAAGGGAETWQPVVWLFKNRRVPALADNAAFALTYAQQLQMRKQDRVVMPALTSPPGSTIDVSQIADIVRLIQCDENSTSVWFELQTLTAFTPGSGAQYNVRFHVTSL